VILHWADAAPLALVAVRGDVNGDGQRSATDVEAAQAQVESKDPLSRADISGDGTVDEQDVRLVERMVNVPAVAWTESFEAYQEGPLAGQGGWLEPGSLPGTLLSAAWVSGSAVVGTDGAALDGTHKATATQPMIYGNEIRFDETGGVGGVGVLKFGFKTRMGAAGCQNMGFYVWNASDNEGRLGAFTVEVAGAVYPHEAWVSASRGIVLGEGTTKVPLEGGIGPESKGTAVDVTVDFGASTLTWQARELDTDTLHGPFTVPFEGTAVGLDAAGFVVRDPGCQVDGLYVTNH
jgi:hypothetical protein